MLSDSVGAAHERGSVTMVGVLRGDAGVDDVKEAIRKTHELVEQLAEGLVSVSGGEGPEDGQVSPARTPPKSGPRSRCPGNNNIFINCIMFPLSMKQ